MQALVSGAFTCRAARVSTRSTPPEPQIRSGLASGRQMAAFALPMMQLTKQPRAHAAARDERRVAGGGQRRGCSSARCHQISHWEPLRACARGGRAFEGSGDSGAGDGRARRR